MQTIIIILLHTLLLEHAVFGLFSPPPPPPPVLSTRVLSTLCSGMMLPLDDATYANHHIVSILHDVWNLDMGQKDVRKCVHMILSRSLRGETTKTEKMELLGVGLP